MYKKLFSLFYYSKNKQKENIEVKKKKTKLILWLGESYLGS